jgi:hypothetical protein
MEYFVIINHAFVILGMCRMHLKQCPQLDGVYKKSIAFQIQINDNYKYLIVLNCFELMIRDENMSYFIQKVKKIKRDQLHYTGCHQ